MNIDYAQRRAWLRHRTTLGLADGALDLSRHPVFSLMADPTCVVTLLPADPLAAPLDFDDDSGSSIPQMFRGEASRMRGASLHQSLVLGSHMLQVSPSETDGPLNTLTGFARHGGAVAGVGRTAGHVKGDYPVLMLNALTSTVRLALTTQAAVHQLSVGKHLVDGPYEMTVALPGAAGSVLGAYASGWQGLKDGLSEPPVCREVHPIVRLEVEPFPTEDADVDRLLTRVMGRVVNLFGTTVPLYAPRNNVSSGVARNY